MFSTGTVFPVIRRLGMSYCVPEYVVSPGPLPDPVGRASPVTDAVIDSAGVTEYAAMPVLVASQATSLPLASMPPLTSQSVAGP